MKPEVSQGDKMMTEKQLREGIRELCRIYGWKFHFTWLAIHSPKGFPDLVLRKPPRIVFAELKREKGKLTPSQIEWIEDLKASGQEIYIWYPHDLPQNISKVLSQEK